MSAKEENSQKLLQNITLFPAEYSAEYSVSAETDFCSFGRTLKIIKIKWLHIWSYVGKGHNAFDRWNVFSIYLNLLTIFSCLFTIFRINHRLSNTFWIYQLRVKYAPFQFYSHLLLIIFNRNTLYVGSDTKFLKLYYFFSICPSWCKYSIQTLPFVFELKPSFPELKICVFHLPNVPLAIFHYPLT